MWIIQGPLFVLLPFAAVVTVAAAVGLLSDLLRGRRERLLASDARRARATLDYFVHVQDSGNA
jgi:hypothetical protein